MLISCISCLCESYCKNYKCDIEVNSTWSTEVPTCDTLIIQDRGQVSRLWASLIAEIYTDICLLHLSSIFICISLSVNQEDARRCSLWPSDWLVAMVLYKYLLSASTKLFENFFWGRSSWTRCYSSEPEQVRTLENQWWLMQLYML